MAYRDKEIARKRSSEWYYANRDKVLEKMKEPAYRQRRAEVRKIWRTKNQERYILYSKEYNSKNRDIQKQKRDQRKLMALEHYGGNPPVCGCCGEGNVGLLTIDHTRDDGNKHRREINQVIYYWLFKHDYPDDLGLAVMCYNCNLGRKNNGGICPHEDFYK